MTLKLFYFNYIQILTTYFIKSYINLKFKAQIIKGFIFDLT